ncbi:hypothetical protein I553_9077 [Mycobacterium xenopi 4042]|uniref:Uncharacterized protein n=1 Tax=Mycobacterium xenopi 4042 TaxID=1299334 RepID=X8AQA0_MYCXE|nr:hypothetical protein I553_9077 [Mycobacterium xenopi 4042]
MIDEPQILSQAATADTHTRHQDIHVVATLRHRVGATGRFFGTAEMSTAAGSNTTFPGGPAGNRQLSAATDGTFVIR